MFSNSKLLSLEGFDHLLDVTKSEVSKKNLIDLIGSVYSQYKIKKIVVLPELELRGQDKKKQARKIAQYNGVLSLVGKLGVGDGIVEVGCGNGKLCEILAEKYDVPVVGLDSNEKLIAKLQSPRENLKYESLDLNNSNYRGDFGVVIGLHCCGNLSDKVIDTGIENNTGIICVPCCYGKTNQEQEILPRSFVLSQRKDEFEYVVKRASSLEGQVDCKKKLKANVFLEIFRRLIDFDRIFYLREHAYEAGFIKITDSKLVFENGKKHMASALRSAIVARKLTQ